ncbi:MAG: DUF333 domain-containing protein [Patescibacteria group bacterium]
MGDKNFKNILFIVIGIIILITAFGLMLIRGNEADWVCQDGQWIMHGRPSAPRPNQPCGDSNQNINDNQNVGLANPASVYCNEHNGKSEIETDAAGGQFGICVFNDGSACDEWAYFRNECQSGKNITVFLPQKDSEVTLPFTVSGLARVFENIINLRLKTNDGTVLFEAFATAQSPDIGQFGEFEKEIDNLKQLPNDQDVTLEVFWYSPKDGTEIDKVSLPLKLNLPQTTAVKLFFTNDKLDPQISCNKVFPIQRFIAKTPAVGQKTLELLLAGPTKDEGNQGYRTSINSGVKINSLKIENATAYADFDDTLQAQVGGSCLTAAIRTEITETLKQFPTVKNVVISINGESETILQP